MHLIKTSLLATALLAVTSLAVPVQTGDTVDSAVSTAGTKYYSGSPGCGIPGFHGVPGNYKTWNHKSSGITLKSCLADCKSDKSCKSVQWNGSGSGTGRCDFYDEAVKDTQLIEDKGSSYKNWDLKCSV